MCRILVLGLMFLVTVRSDFTCSVNSCTCDVVDYSYLAASCSKHTSDVLDSNQIKLGVNVVSIDIFNVQFKILPEFVFAKARVVIIKRLYLNKCGIETIDINAFSNLTELRNLSVAFNKVTRLSVGTFKTNRKLRELYFQYNKLEILQDGLLDELTFLQKVSFEHNHIKRIGEALFALNLQLIDIKLAYNELSYINGSMLKQLPKLGTFSMAFNPWKCDCKLIPLHEMSLQFIWNDAPDCNNINNFGPIKTRQWTAITQDDFKCKPIINTWYITDLDLSSRITLFCKVTAKPRAFANMFKVTAENSATQRHKSTTEEHTYIYETPIDNIETELNSTYKCYASNELGEDEKIIIINEIYFKFIGSKRKPIPKHSKRHDNITLNCTRFTYNTSDVKWYFRNNSIQNNSSKFEIQTFRSTEGGIISILIIKNITNSDKGIYKCTNYQKDTEQYFNLTVTPEVTPELLSPIILTVVLLILILVIVSSVFYYKHRRRNQVQQPIIYDYATIERKSTNTNEYVENKNEHIEESSIYVSSDHNIYEDIVYGPVSK